MATTLIGRRAEPEPLEFVPPRWGTRRRTREEWLDLGGAGHLAPKSDPWWPSLGNELVDVSRRLLIPSMPHQAHVFGVAFELDPFSEFEFDLWYSEINVWVMRQCGKTMGILFPIGVHRCTRMPRHMGVRQRVSFTMQDRQETRKKFELDMIPQLVDAADSFRRIENPKARPGRSTREWKSSLNNGAEHLLFGRGNYFLIDTPSKKAGHGGTIDVKLADEARFGVNDKIEASAGPAGITRRSFMLAVASTAGDDESFWMWPKVLAGRNRIERDDRETRVCSFEWSVPDGAELDDVDVWREHHPAVGRTITFTDLFAELRKAEDSPDDTKIDTFRQEHANQWVRTPVIGEGERPLVIAAQPWAAAGEHRGPFAGPVAVGVDVSPDGQSASLVLAGWNTTGRVQVRVVELQAGVFWVEDRLAELVAEHDPVAVAYDAGGPANAIAGAIARAAGVVPVVRLTGRDYAAACEAFVTGIVEGRYAHCDQAWLTSALGGATTKQRGDGWLWDRQSTFSDITPIVAATVAARAIEMHQPDTDPESAFVSMVLGGGGDDER